MGKSEVKDVIRVTRALYTVTRGPESQSDGGKCGTPSTGASRRKSRLHGHCWNVHFKRVVHSTFLQLRMANKVLIATGGTRRTL